LSLSFSGIVTFRSAQELRAVVPLVPMDRLLIETDCPYLAPVPYRGRRNEPAYVSQVAVTLAQIKAVPPEEVAQATWRNTAHLFRLDA
jgi:TatD DNase family protein